MKEKIRRYEGESIAVIYDAERCIHVAECVRRLPAVFDAHARPWVQPDASSADEIAEAVCACPTGALRYERKDGGAEESSPDRNTVVIDADGALLVAGDVEVVDAAGNTLLREPRLALCRCGASENKPLCDRRHTSVDFRDQGNIPDPKIRETDSDQTHLRVVVAANGPLILDGPVEIVDADGKDRCSGTKTALCRCGQSANKPFCDGAHAKAGFTAP